MTQPEQLKQKSPLLWSPGMGSDVWEMFCACIKGDLETITRLVEKDPSLTRCHYSYRTPLYFAVRENQLEVAAFLLEHGADPIDQDLLTITRDRGYPQMEKLLEKHSASFRGASPKGEAVAEAIRQRDLPKMHPGANIGTPPRTRRLRRHLHRLSHR